MDSPKKSCLPLRCNDRRSSEVTVLQLLRFGEPILAITRVRSAYIGGILGAWCLDWFNPTKTLAGIILDTKRSPRFMLKRLHARIFSAIIDGGLVSSLRRGVYYGESSRPPTDPWFPHRTPKRWLVRQALSETSETGNGPPVSRLGKRDSIRLAS